MSLLPVKFTRPRKFNRDWVFDAFDARAHLPTSAFETWPAIIAPLQLPEGITPAALLKQPPETVGLIANKMAAAWAADLDVEVIGRSAKGVTDDPLAVLSPRHRTSERQG